MPPKKKKASRKTSAKKKAPAKKRSYKKSGKKSKGFPRFLVFVGFAILVFFAYLHFKNLKLEVHLSDKKEVSAPTKPILKPERKIPQKPMPTPAAAPAPPPRKAAVVTKAPPQPLKKAGQTLSNKPKMIFVIDDIGYHLKHETLINQLGDHVVYAVLPLLPYSKHFANLGYRNGADVILHLPLETIDGTIPGRGLITHQMDERHILETLNRNLASVPHHIGSNNHMGSLGTSDEAIMQVVLGEIKRRNLFFLDSVTTSQSVVSSMAKRTGTRHIQRDIFLDNIDAKPAIRNQIWKQKRIARTQGYAIGIGHYRDTTLSVLLDMIPQLKEEGFEIVSLSDLLDYLGK